MQSFRFDREKYLSLYEKQGASIALTTLQKDIERWEYQSFEGKDGYRPDMVEALEDVRVFFRELWDRSIRENRK